MHFRVTWTLSLPRSSSAIFYKAHTLSAAINTPFRDNCTFSSYCQSSVWIWEGNVLRDAPWFGSVPHTPQRSSSNWEIVLFHLMLVFLHSSGGICSFSIRVLWIKQYRGTSLSLFLCIHFLFHSYTLSCSLALSLSLSLFSNLSDCSSINML